MKLIRLVSFLNFKELFKFTAFEKDGCGIYTDNEYTIMFDTLDGAYEFLRDQTPTQFIHPFPEE